MRLYEKEVGRLLDGRYKLLDLLGSGASGAVFRAYDILKNRQVSIKLYDTGADGESGERNRNFLTEARAIAALSSDHIVKLYDAGVTEQDYYLSMEFIDGTTLREYLDRRLEKSGFIPTEEILSCARQVLTALKAAHREKIVHRDIKPQNIIVTKTGKIKVMDFGIAQLPGNDTGGDGTAVGTAYYISPEQAGGNVVDARSDIYSFGVVLYEMATGCLPFTGATPSEIARRQVQDTPMPPRALNPGIPIGLEQLILTAMQKNPDRRFTSAEEMLRAVDKLTKKNDHVFEDFGKTAVTAAGERRKLAGQMGQLPLFLAMVGGACALLCVVLFLLLGRGWIHSPETETVMPDLVLQTYAENATYGKNLTIKEVHYAYSDTVPAGAIIAQTPAAGSRYAGSISVTLTVSLGKEVHDDAD